MELYMQERQKYLEHPEKYWAEKLKSLTWFKKWEKLHNFEPGKHNNEWFIGGKINLCYELLDKRVQEGHGDDVALTDDSSLSKTITHYTTREILDKVSRLAGVLSDCGVQEGDHVSIYLPMIFEIVVSIFASVRLGAFYSLMNTMPNKTAMAIRLDDFKPKVIITTNCELNPQGEIFNPKQHLDNVLNQCNHKPNKIIVLQRKYAKPAELFVPRDVDWEEAEARATNHDFVPIEINRPVYLIHTSGTSGIPKSVVISALSIITNSFPAGKSLIGTSPKSGEHKAIFCLVSYLWISGHLFSLYVPLLQRFPIILWERTLYNLQIGDLLKSLAYHKVSSMLLPTHVARRFIKQDPNGEICNLYKSQLNFEYIYLGGLPGDEPTFEWVKRHITPNCAQLYALTETGLITTVDIGNDKTFSRHPVMSSGKIKPGITVKILRLDGTESNVDEIGRIAIKLPVPTLSSGFLGDENRQKFTSSYLIRFPGYFDTNDEGHFDSKGNLYVLNRADSVFKIAGQRITCNTLEEVIMTHPDIDECIVVPRNQPEVGEVPVGLFVTNKMAQKSGKDIAQELEKLVATQIGNWITFNELIQVKTIPKTQNGKCDKGTVIKIIQNAVKGQIIDL